MRRLIVINIPLILYSLTLNALVGNEVVYQKLFTNSSLVNQYITVRNIGQISHRAYVKFSNNGANVCVNPLAGFYLLGSFDGVSYHTIDRITIGTELQLSLKGTQPYPYIQVALTIFDSVNCVATGYYIGTMTAIPQEIDIADSNAPMQLGTGTHEFLGARAGNSIHIGSVNLNVGTDNASIGFGYGPIGGGCAPYTPLSYSFTLLKGHPLVLGSNLGSLFTLPVNTSFCVVIADETANTKGMLKYKYKPN